VEKFVVSWCRRDVCDLSEEPIGLESSCETSELIRVPAVTHDWQREVCVVGDVCFGYECAVSCSEGFASDNADFGAMCALVCHVEDARGRIKMSQE
jgi:hypothetical protein